MASTTDTISLFLTRLKQVTPRGILTPLALMLVTFTVVVTAFASIADAVREHRTSAFDDAILLAIHRISSPVLDILVSLLTEFGGLVGVVVLTTGAMALLIVRKHWLRAVYLGIAVGGAALLNLALKLIFARSRPDLWDHIVTELSYSFPSGHAMCSMALGAGLVIAMWHSSYRLITIVASAVFVLIIGFTRLYLGVHYPTDVLAGWFVSLAWVILVKLLFTYQFKRRIT